MRVHILESEVRAVVNMKVSLTSEGGRTRVEGGRQEVRGVGVRGSPKGRRDGEGTYLRLACQSVSNCHLVIVYAV